MWSTCGIIYVVQTIYYRDKYYRDGDPKEWPMVPFTALGSWEKLVPCGQLIYDIIGSDVVQEGAV